MGKGEKGLTATYRKRKHIYFRSGMFYNRQDQVSHGRGLARKDEAAYHLLELSLVFTVSLVLLPIRLLAGLNAVNVNQLVSLEAVEFFGFRFLDAMEELATVIISKRVICSPTCGAGLVQISTGVYLPRICSVSGQ